MMYLGWEHDTQARQRQSIAVLSSALPENAFLAWGGRVPFLISVVLVGVGLFIRLRILETPAFVKVKNARRESTVPLVDLFRQHPREVLIGMGLRFAQNVVFYIYTFFVLSYGEKSLGYPRSIMLRSVMLTFSGGLAPFISTLLLARHGPAAVAGYIAGCCTITLLAAWFGPETRRVNLDDAVAS